VSCSSSLALCVGSENLSKSQRPYIDSLHVVTTELVRGQVRFDQRPRSRFIGQRLKRAAFAIFVYTYVRP
jgi:hypothetical protein